MFCFGSSGRSVNQSGHLTLFPNSDLQPATCKLHPPDFFHHLFSVIYAYFFAVRFVVDFERLANTFQFLKMIHGRYLRSYFNLFLIHAVAGDVNTCLYKYKKQF